MRRILFALFLVLPFGGGCHETYKNLIAEWYVASGGSDFNDGSYWYPLASISEAMYRADKNDIIFVDPGTYSTGESFPIFVKDGVTIEGDIATKGAGGAQATFVQGSASDALFVMGAGSKIRGLKIQNTGGRGVRAENVTATIEFNTITGCSTDGVLVAGSGSSNLNNNAITGNNTGGVADGGVVANDSATPVLRSNTITGNTGDGVRANGTSNPNLGDASSNGNNTIQSNTGFGLNNSTSGTPQTINARGNTWIASTQGADAAGQYPPGFLDTDPEDVVGSNYNLEAGTAIQF